MINLSGEEIQVFNVVMKRVGHDEWFEIQFSLLFEYVGIS